VAAKRLPAAIGACRIAFPASAPLISAAMAALLTDTLIEEPRWEALGLPALAERAALAALARLGLDPASHEIAILGAGDARITALNAEFRGKPLPTNVLSWPADDLSPKTEGAPPRPPAPGPLGDIALSWETCEAEARAAGKPLADHAAHLLVHGTLHLLGYDHIREGDGALMEALETEILASLGIADPY
jgi:probable rRNA maturation factor